MYNIFKSSINNEFPLDKYNNEGSEQYFMIKSEIKICSIYTAIISYLLQDFHSFYKDEHLSKISKQLFILIMNNKYLDKKNSNDIVNSILIWLNDDANIKEDITEIFYNINWESVDEALIFELMVKYAHFIINNESLQIMFSKIFEEKYGGGEMIKNLINNILSASKKINYEQIFTQMKRNVKFNNAFINHNSYYVMNNNYINNEKSGNNVDGGLNNKQKSESKYQNNNNSINNEKNIVIRKNKSNDYKFIKGNNNIKNKNIKDNKNINTNEQNKKNKNLIINYTNPTNVKKNQFKNIKLQKPIKPNLKLIVKNIDKDNNKIKNKIEIKKINKPKLIKHITNKSYDKNGRIKTNLTKKSTTEFMKLMLNSSNSNFSNFQTSFNKSFNNLKKFK